MQKYRKKSGKSQVDGFRRRNSTKPHLVTVVRHRGSRAIKWTEISRQIFFQSDGAFYKTPKQCREHWNNHLNDTINHDCWNIEEDIMILEFVREEGRKWAKLGQLLEGTRTQHMIKNRFHSMMTCAKKILKGRQESSKKEQQIINSFIKILQTKKEKENKRLKKIPLVEVPESSSES